MESITMLSWMSLKCVTCSEIMTCAICTSPLALLRKSEKPGINTHLVWSPLVQVSLLHCSVCWFQIDTMGWLRSRVEWAITRQQALNAQRWETPALDDFLSTCPPNWLMRKRDVWLDFGQDLENVLGIPPPPPRALCSQHALDPRSSTEDSCHTLCN